MSSTKIEFNANRIARMSDTSDLAEVLFPGNRNQQHGFMAIWFSLKWADRGLVPNFDGVAREHDITPRTLERVRAKLRRLGLIDHVSRFSAKHGYREGWVLSTRFERTLGQLAGHCANLASKGRSTADKDELQLHVARARRDAVTHDRKAPTRLANAGLRVENP